MDESRGPHQTWVGPQPASTETLPVPPPSHTNYAPRPNLASPGERVVLDATEMSSFFSINAMSHQCLGGCSRKASRCWKDDGGAADSIDHCL